MDGEGGSASSVEGDVLRLAVWLFLALEPWLLTTQRALGPEAAREGRGPRLAEICSDEKPETGPGGGGQRQPQGLAHLGKWKEGGRVA